MNNINFNWESRINGEEVQCNKRKSIHPYAYLAKNGRIYLNVDHFSTRQVAVGYDEEINSIVLRHPDFAPSNAPTRKMSQVSNRACNTYCCCVSSLVQTLYKQGKIKGFGRANSVNIGVTDCQINIYLDCLVK